MYLKAALAARACTVEDITVTTAIQAIQPNCSIRVACFFNDAEDKLIIIGSLFIADGFAVIGLILSIRCKDNVRR